MGVGYMRRKKYRRRRPIIKYILLVWIIRLRLSLRTYCTRRGIVPYEERPLHKLSSYIQKIVLGFSEPLTRGQKQVKSFFPYSWRADYKWDVLEERFINDVTEYTTDAEISCAIGRSQDAIRQRRYYIKQRR